MIFALRQVCREKGTTKNLCDKDFAEHLEPEVRAGFGAI